MPRVILAVVLALVAVGQQRSNIKDLRKLIGQTQRMCGAVVTFLYPPGTDGDCSVQLQVGGPYWEPLFYILIPKDALPSFETPPEARYLSQQVCVTGLVKSDDKHIPHIVVASPSQIELPHEEPIATFGNGALRTCEPDVVKPKLLKSVKPSYPSADLVRRGIEDHVFLQAVIGEDGTVTDVRTVYARDPELSAAAQAALRQWRFSGGTRRGVPVRVLAAVDIKFTLR
jgi:TonB family protein